MWPKSKWRSFKHQRENVMIYLAVPIAEQGAPVLESAVFDRDHRHEFYNMWIEFIWCREKWASHRITKNE